MTGYVGAELARLLDSHPAVEIHAVTGRTYAGKRLPEAFPHLWHLDLPIDETLDATNLDVVFSALPHAASAEALVPLIATGTRVIDCSADFRIRNLEIYENWYGKHPAPELLNTSIYGLPELHREAIKGASIVAVPGCYPTTALLGLAPLAKAGWLNGDVIIDAKSGVSGAGRTLRLETHFSEVDENLSAYGLDGHRHQPEIAQELANLLPPNSKISVTFVPHLAPMTRGLLAACYPSITHDLQPPNSTTNQTEVRALLFSCYADYYSKHPFVEVVSAPPSTKQTLGSNTCPIFPTTDTTTGQVIVISCLDNLVKGAAGTAIQCLDLMFNLDETSGLSRIGIYP